MMPARTASVATALVVAASLAHGQCPVEFAASPKPAYKGSFGRSVEVSGHIAVVADPSDHSYCPIFTCSSGAVHVFRRIEGRWQSEAMLFHSRISERDGFGGAISLDGPDRFAASAPGEAVVGPPGTGAIYIFEHDGERWREVAEILPVEPEEYAVFGGTLALRGDTLIVGAPQHVEGEVKPGAASVYRLIDGQWQFVQKLVPPDPRNGARFSNAMALDGEWLVVGARLDDEGGHHAGAAFLYRQAPGGRFAFVRKLLAPGDPWNQLYGASVAMDADTLVIGASNGPTVGRGAVYVLEFDGAEWRYTALLEHDDPVTDDALGASVAFRGNIIVAGAPRQIISGFTFGVAYAFQRQPEGSWRQASKLLPTEPSFDFGRAVATDGVTAIVGSPQNWVGEVQQAGEAFIYDLPCLLCRADLDGDGELTFFDFLAFQNLYVAGDITADFDGDGDLTFFDFLAFQNEFAAGCA